MEEGREGDGEEEEGEMGIDERRLHTFSYERREQRWV